MKYHYAGIGSRGTPPGILSVMELLGSVLCDIGWTLRSGNCQGADQAFQRGANSIDPNKVHLFLPWRKYERGAVVSGNVLAAKLTEEDFEIAGKFHPAWHMCNDNVKRLHARNTQIILGEDRNTPVEFVICWTPNEEHGGTSQGIRVARDSGIPVHNLSTDTGIAFAKSLLGKGD